MLLILLQFMIIKTMKYVFCLTHHRDNKLNCLINTPDNMTLMNKDVKQPGMIYTRDDQCRMALGVQAISCTPHVSNQLILRYEKKLLEFWR